MMVNSQFIFECWEFSAIDQNQDRVCQIYVFKAFQTEQVRMELQEGGRERFVYFLYLSEIRLYDVHVSSRG